LSSADREPPLSVSTSPDSLQINALEKKAVLKVGRAGSDLAHPILGEDRCELFL
jgi:hypothetical protein